MNAVLWTRTTLAGFALHGLLVSSAALAQAPAPKQITPQQQAQYEAALGDLHKGQVQACEGDLTRVRYPYEVGLRRARGAAENDLNKMPSDARRQALLEAIDQLPVRRERPGGSRDAAPEEQRAARARKAARESFNLAIARLEWLLAAHPTHVAWQHDLARAYARLAAVSGGWKPARDLHQKAVDLHKTVLATDSTNKAWQRDLADLYQGLGTIQFSLGGEKLARDAKVAELNLREKLAEEVPADNELQRALALNYDRLGEMFHTIGNTSQARAAYQAGLETLEPLVQRDPANLVWQADLTRNREGFSALEIHRGKEAVGARLQHDTLRMRAALVERDPADVEAQRWLRDSYLAIARHHQNGVETEQALAIYREGLQHMQRLAERYPADPGWLYYQLEFQFYIGYTIQDEIRPRLGTREPPPRAVLERVTAQTQAVTEAMLATSRALVALSTAPATLRIYETAQAPRLCTIPL